MGNIFNYESKFNQALMKLGDIIIVNFLFLLFSIPIFTIGAAEAGLCTAFRVMTDPEDDSSVAGAFFRGFKNGFTIITPVYAIMTLVCFVIGYCCVAIYIDNGGKTNFSVIISGVAAIIVFIFQSLIGIFHSRFSCTRLQLLRNSYLLLFAFPLRSLSSVALLWAPLIIFLLDSFLFIQFAPLWFTIWFGVAGLTITSLMRKPFRTAEEAFLESQEEANAEAEDEENLLIAEESAALPADEAEQAEAEPAPQPAAEAEQTEAEPAPIAE